MIWYKAERQFTVPAVGVNPIPTSSECDTEGVQQAYRRNMPSWVVKYVSVAVSGESPKVLNIVIPWAKMHKGVMKDGDYYGLGIFNRTNAAVDFDVEMMYKSWG